MPANKHLLLVSLLILFATAVIGQADTDSAVRSPLIPRGSTGTIYEKTYEPSTKPGELAFGVLYRIWIPNGVKTLRGVIVHQHGCGTGSCKSGETAADDLHWQALAAKWDCALLGPSYRQPEKADCQLWCNPKNGSDNAFQKALAHFAWQSGHKELTTIPWALWGHSGGGTWSGYMVLRHPERIIGAWLRSGAPIVLPSESLPKLVIPEAAFSVPIIYNVGIKERTGRFARGWKTGFAFFETMRKKNALFGVAIDPLTSHECGDSRYPAIRFLDKCLRERLPEKAGDPQLRSMTRNTPGVILPISELKLIDTNIDNSLGFWLPDEEFVKDWKEYSATGHNGDTTLPPAPFELSISPYGMMTWQATADFESGLAGFIIEHNGKEVAALPEKKDPRFGRPLYQGMSYSDTPVPPVQQLSWQLPEKYDGVWGVRAVNTLGLKSEPVTIDTSKQSWTVTFEDDFNSPKLDEKKWVPYYRPKYRNVIKSPAHYVIENGILKVRVAADLPKRSKPLASSVSSIQTSRHYFEKNSEKYEVEDKFVQKYGYFELRCRMPAGSGLHSAFWLLQRDPKDQEYDLAGKRKKLGDGVVEIDIFEQLGAHSNENLFNVHFTRNGHYKQLLDFDASKEFHVWALDWQEGKLTWYLDGKPIRRYEGETPKQPMFILLGLYLGSGWTGPVDPNMPFPRDFEIDSVRVWQRTTANSKDSRQGQ